MSRSEQDPLWYVFVMPSMHQDISYQKSAEEDLQLFVSEYDKYLALMEKEPTWCYSSEFAYAVRYFLEKHPQQRSRMRRFVKEGRFGITAQCAGFNPAFYSGEFIIREIAGAKHWLQQEFGYAPRTLHLADVPDFAPQLPQIMAGCEVDLFLCDRMGSGEGLRGNVLDIGEFPGLWESLDNEVFQVILRPMGWDKGKGKFAALYPGYWRWKAEHKDDQPRRRLWHQIGLDGTPILAYAPSMRYFGLRGLERKPGEIAANRLDSEEIYLSNLNADFEPGHVALGIGGFDERPIDATQVVENVAAWNREREAERRIHLEMSTAEPFTEQMVKAVDQGEVEIGKYSGTAPGWRYQHFDPDALAYLQNQLPTAEMLASFNALLGLADYPVDKIREAWEILWQISHNQLSDPSYDQALGDSHLVAQQLLEDGMGQLTKAIAPAQHGQPIMVFNPLNWSRTESVSVRLKSDALLGVVDGEGQPVPFAISRTADDTDGRAMLTLVAHDVPGMGYRVFYIQESPHAETDLEWGERWIQNRHVRIALDNKGSVTIRNRVSGRELVPEGSYGSLLRIVGQGQEGELSWHLKGVRAEGNAVEATLRIEGTVSRSPAQIAVSLTSGSPRFDLTVDIDWDGERGVALYLPLPFAFDPDELITGVACGHIPYVQPTAPAVLRHAPLSRRSAQTTFSTFWYFPLPHAPIPGDDFSWSYMQKWAYLGACSGSVACATGRRNGMVVGDGVLAVPLFSTPARRIRHSRRENAFEVGPHHYALAFSAVSDTEAATRLGWEVAQPLQATTAWEPGGNLKDCLSLLHLGPQQVIPMALKQSEDELSWILRFFESADEDIVAHVRPDRALGLGRIPCHSVNLIEVQHEAVLCTGDTLSVPLRGFQIKTLRFG